ncbi:1175_t:CDS:2, partial [Paraglomus occultum]
MFVGYQLTCQFRSSNASPLRKLCTNLTSKYAAPRSNSRHASKLAFHTRRYIYIQKQHLPLKLANYRMQACRDCRRLLVTQVENSAILPQNMEWRTVSFYRFKPIPEKDLPQLREQMLSDFGRMNIVGRIYIATEGINAQMSCPKENIGWLREYCDNILDLQNIDLNFATEHSKAFDALHVRIRKQIVADGLESGSYDITKQPNHLDPEEWHQALSSKPQLVIDMRNHYESEIGYFEGAIRPDVDTFRESVKVMEEICKGKQDQEVYMYCTGGIRCSKAGAVLRSAGFKSVNVLKGGITAYGHYVKENPTINSLYKGRNFTFDRRLGERITNDVLSQCHTCGKSCNTHTNCRNSVCNLLFIQCDDCRIRLKETCGHQACLKIVENMAKRSEDNTKPGVEPWYEHGVRTRPKAVLE